MVKLNKKSKRQTTRLRAKIEKKVREHNRKVKRDAKKKPNSNKKRKDPGVPNSLPFKEIILKEAEDRKKLLEEERQRKKEARKKEREKLFTKKRKSDGLDQVAQSKTLRASQKLKLHKKKNVDSSLKSVCKEFRKVVDTADVVLEVLDARDPLGSRCPELENAVVNSEASKRLVLVLNKIDLVPKENVEAWLKYLKNEFPVVAFKASMKTQKQNEHPGQKKLTFIEANPDFIKISSSFGADALKKLLGNYCSNKSIKTPLRVGVVGLPNTGKSSIINTLMRSEACIVGALPGITKQMQEVHLDKQIRLLDSPSVVIATNSSDTSLILRNCVNLENVNDVMSPVEAILKKCNKQQMMLLYCLPEYKDVNEFLSLLAHRLGRLKKGGLPDVSKAARSVIQDWNMGKIGFYTNPPEQNNMQKDAETVANIGKEFNMDSLLLEQLKEIDIILKKGSIKHMLVESLGPVKIAMKFEDVQQIVMTSQKESATDNSFEEENAVDDSGSNFEFEDHKSNNDAEEGSAEDDSGSDFEFEDHKSNNDAEGSAEDDSGSDFEFEDHKNNNDESDNEDMDCNEDDIEEDGELKAVTVSLPSKASRFNPSTRSSDSLPQASKCQKTKLKMKMHRK